MIHRLYNRIGSFLRHPLMGETRGRDAAEIAEILDALDLRLSELHRELETATAARAADPGAAGARSVPRSPARMPAHP